MVGVRHALLVVLAVIGLVTALSVSSAAVACPAAPTAAPVHHHGACGHSVPASQPNQPPPMFCAACIAVLPSLPTAEPQVLRPFTSYASNLQSLSGIDPALDPPPPRRA